MNRSLLFAVAAASALGLGAVTPQQTTTSLVAGSASLRPGYVKDNNAVVLEKPADGVTLKSVSRKAGRTMKKLELAGSQRIQPRQARRAPKAETTEGVSFFESFEGWDKTTTNWLPEGWTLESKGDATLEANEKWGVDEDQSGYLPAPPDGTCSAMISFAMDNKAQDEWMITPEITVSENEILSFHAYANVFFFFDTDLVDWDAMEFTERKVICDIEVLVQPAGGEWQKVWNLTDCYADVSVSDMLMTYGQTFQKYQIPLTDYSGQTVKVAFRYVGTNGDSSMIDAVTVGLPSLEGVCYSHPFETLYWGYDRQAGWGSLGLKVAQYPVLAPISWQNNTWNDAATYSWRYHDPVTNDWATSDEQDVLTVTYAPNYTSEFTSRNNMYYPPVLVASAPGATPGEFTAAYDYLQVGGKPEFMLTDQSTGERTLWETGLLPFELNTEGITYLIKDDQTVGDPAIPIFGYNENTDKYWLNYTLNGEEPSEGDDVRVTAIMNYIMPAAAPLVVNGVHVMGVGQVSDNAEFIVKIVPLSDEGIPEMENPIASATCKGSDLVRYDGGVNQFITVPFDFETPVVIDNSRVGYMVIFSGFHSPEVTYWAPVQSALPHPDYMAFGWIVKEIKINGADTYRESYTPIAYHEGEYGDCYNGFGINLCGYYPWLDSETSEIDLPADGTPVTVPLSSYHDGAAFQIDAPAGVDAAVTGRYGQCVLTVSRNDAAVEPSGDITLTAPGVTKSFAVKSNGASIDGVAADNLQAVPVEAFTPDGKRVAVDNAANGIFIVRYSDGSVRKTILK